MKRREPIQSQSHLRLKSFCKSKTSILLANMGRPEYKFLIGIVSLILGLFFMPGLPFSAESPGLKVSGASLVTEVSPGESLNHQIIVALSPADAAADIVLEVYPLGQAPDGSYIASSENNQYSAFSFINLDKSSFHLEPGDSSKVTVSIQVPQDAGIGGRYALINLRTQPGDQGSIGVVRSVNIPVYLTYKDTDLIHTGQITETSTGDITNGKSIDILTLFKNTGNHHFKIKSEVIISDSSGTVQEVLYTSLTHSSIVPEATRQLKATYIPRSELPVGKYSYSSTIRLEDGTLLDEVRGSFEIREVYAPPLPPVSLDVSPMSVGELKTDEGNISVLLDSGSVISQTHLSLVIIPVDQLPAPPAGCNLTGPCFRVDGLNGLLVKPALVRIKYSGQDLEQTDGVASRLVLARWDQFTGKWITLKTTQDEKELTLSAETDQFGIMTVMVEPVLSKNDWSRLWVALAAVVIIAVVLFRRKRT
jgi:hypothetical protein